MPSRPVLSDRLEAVAKSYEKLLAVHLVNVIEALLAQAPEFCELSGLAEAWGVAKRLKGGVLARAVRQPTLDLWVKTSERLLEIGVHQRYPRAHFIRHLKDFARLVLSWAGGADEGAEGRVELLARRVTPIAFGTLLLEVTGYSPDEELTWRVESQVLRVGLVGKGPLAEINLSGGSEIWPANSRCRLIVPPVVGGALADIWTPEYVGGRNAPLTEESFRGWAERVGAALTEEHVPLISRFCRSLTVAPSGEEWVAGLARVGSPLDDITPLSLVELAHRDCIERLLRLIPLGEVTCALTIYGDPHAILIELGSRRVTSRLLGGGPAYADASRWAKVAAHLKTSAAGRKFLDIMGEESEPSDVHAPAPAEAPPSLAGVLKATGVESPAFGRLQLRKTRHESTNPTDWGALDTLQFLTRDELERVYRGVVGDCATSEAAAYCAAVSSYILGEFESCQAALLHCLRHDRDVEEYWHLLAFTMRHLGRPQGFNRVVFGDERDLSSLGSLLAVNHPDSRARRS